ncbi:hypothetical protein F8154_10870 [Alkaliphilus pronyensis]|uniref:Uncharacterized protein n=1 Tax=Alkaliphilus pronyensis TaxID=1482732 RepID=A0A6I0F9S6_9FIRM|nr:hypothetical protein [Alkaliphilus pronyensis]KAB3533496.1 hypothetical protein F8154_10870 [Alkaliphilus pronyensis]
MSKKIEMEKLVDDLVFIKQAIRKNNNVFKYFSVSRAMKWVLLYAGILIISLSLLINTIITRYASWQLAPTGLKLLIYGAAIVGLLVIVVIKLRTIVKAAKSVESDMSVVKLIKEVYTGQTLMIIIPYFISIVLIITFFNQQDLNHFIAPFLAVLFGLLTNSLVNVFHVKEMIVMGDWLILTGFIALFFLNPLNPAIIVALTFGLGCIIMYLAILFSTKREEE